MKKYGAILLTSIMCACCLGLAACGGGGASSSAAASASASAAASPSASAAASASASASASAAASASASASASAADPAAKFIGDWQIAGAEFQGVRVAGDFSSGVFGMPLSMTVSVAEGGTGIITRNDEQSDFTWELKDDNTLAIVPQNPEAGLDSLNATYADGTLAFEMSDEEFSGKVILSKDGTAPGYEPVSAANAKNVTAASEVVGTWKMTGVIMSGISMYGDPQTLSEAMGGSLDSTLVVNEDGTAQAMGENVEWKLDSNGATIDIGGGTQAPMKLLDGDLLVDGSSFMGSDLYMMFSK